MKYQRMGRSGLQVPPLCLGTMTFGLQVDQATSFNILDEAFEQKLTFLDTADGLPAWWRSQHHWRDRANHRRMDETKRQQTQDPAGH